MMSLTEPWRASSAIKNLDESQHFFPVEELNSIQPDQNSRNSLTRILDRAVGLLISGKCVPALVNQDSGGPRAQRDRPAMFATAARWAAKKGKPKMAPIELTAPLEQAQSITRAIFDVVREHGPLTISDVWDHVKVQRASTPADPCAPRSHP